MRIALCHAAPSGGAKRAIHEWTRRLSRRHDVDVYTLETAEHAFCDVRPFVRRHEMYQFSPRRLLRTPVGRLNQLQRLRDLGSIDRLMQTMARDIDRRGYDVVFAHTCRHTVVPLVLRHLRTPSVFYLHEPPLVSMASEAAGREDAASWWRALLDRVDPLIPLYRRRLVSAQQSALGRATLLANSIYTRDAVRRVFGTESTVCRTGVDVQEFVCDEAAVRGSHVLSVGELSPRKGFGFVVRSLARIPRPSRPPLVLACNRVDGPERARVEALARLSDVELSIVSHLDTPSLVAEYQRARLCVYAPHNEPFGLVPLEAMACGTPVVAVREGGVVESIVPGETGELTARDPDEFARATSRLLSDRTLAARYARAGRTHVVRHWTWEHSVAQLERELAALASRPAGSLASVV